MRYRIKLRNPDDEIEINDDDDDEWLQQPRPDWIS